MGVSAQAESSTWRQLQVRYGTTPSPSMNNINIPVDQKPCASAALLDTAWRDEPGSKKRGRRTGNNRSCGEELDNWRVSGVRLNMTSLEVDYRANVVLGAGGFSGQGGRTEATGTPW